MFKNTACYPNFAAFAIIMLLKIVKLRKHCIYFCFHVYKSLSIREIKRKDRRDLYGLGEKIFYCIVVLTIFAIKTLFVMVD